MRNVLIEILRFAGWVVGALPRAICAIVGVLLMGLGALTQLGDTIAGNEGRPTFFLQLGELTQRIGLSPWDAVFMYYAPYREARDCIHCERQKDAERTTP